MAVNELLTLWGRYKTSPRDASPSISSDRLKNGTDFLSLASDLAFEEFLRAQLGNEEISGKLGFATVLEWLTDSSSNHPSAAGRVRDWPFYGSIHLPAFLDRVRQSIWRSISGALENARTIGLLPEAGLVLYFTDGLKYCYLISYHLHYKLPVVEILDRISEPTGILEIQRINSLQKHRSRNRAKAYLTSGHKVVMQKGVLTHVDRHLDKNVFGPTIDTLILADTLLRSDLPEKTKAFLEIGSGNGHIASTMSAFGSNLTNILTIDVNEFAVSCTTRNVRTNRAFFHPLKPSETDPIEVYAVCGPFRGQLFQRKFDLIVSNPPYIEKPASGTENFPERFPEAVGGTKLIRDILATLPEMLKDDGQLLLMTSSVTGDISTSLPPGFTLRPAYDGNGIEVPFDVEEVLEQEPWLKNLERSGAVWSAGSDYKHFVKPVWIGRNV